jgi:hypothetical protein
MADSTGGPTSLAEVIKRLEELGGAAFTFGPAYFSDLALADRERLRTAKRLLGGTELARTIYFEKLRLWRDGATHCAWCENELVELRHTRAIGGRLLHLGCAHQYDRSYAEWSGSIEITDAGREALNHSTGAA